MENKTLSILEVFQAIDHTAGNEYCIMINGQKAIDLANEIIGNSCYKPIYLNQFIGQLEIVIDEDGQYNGFDQKWISFAFIPHYLVNKAIAWLQDKGFTGLYATIRQEDPQTSDYIPDFPEYPFIIPENNHCDNANLPTDKLVVFNINGKKYKAKYPTYDSRFDLWAICENDENNMPYLIYSNEVIDKPIRKQKAKFIPSRGNCTARIIPSFKTEKAYAIEDGSNGLYGKGCKVYYKYIAKSICFVDEDGAVYAPVWAVK